MSYNIARVFINSITNKISFDYGGFRVPKKPHFWNHSLFMTEDAIVFSVKTPERVWNILFWQSNKEIGDKWETTLFSPVPKSFRFYTDAQPLFFPQVIKDDQVREAAIRFYSFINLNPDTKEIYEADIRQFFHTDEEETDYLFPLIGPADE